MIKSKIHFLIFVALFSCANAQHEKRELMVDKYPEKVNGWVLNRVFQMKASDSNYTLMLNGIRYNIQFYVPENNNNQLVLFLPGWNLPASDWKTKTHVVDSALNAGYCALLVDMGKSIYLDTFYSNIRSDYRNYPTRQWLWDIVLKPYRDAGFFSDVTNGLKSHVFGLSTGARGAISLAQDYHTTINFVAALSGDYNPLLDTSDALMINAMGRFYLYPERWKYGTNNLTQNGRPAADLFIAHGKKDKIVNVHQSVEFAEEFKVQNYKSQVVRYFPENSGHDYEFWNDAGLRALNQLKALYP